MVANSQQANVGMKYVIEPLYDLDVAVLEKDRRPT